MMDERRRSWSLGNLHLQGKKKMGSRLQHCIARRWFCGLWDRLTWFWRRIDTLQVEEKSDSIFSKGAYCTLRGEE